MWLYSDSQVFNPVACYYMGFVTHSMCTCLGLLWSHTHTYIHSTYVHTSACAHIHKCTYAHTTHTYTHTYTNSHTNTHPHTSKHTHIHTHAHMYTHNTRTHTHTRTHIITYSTIHTQRYKEEDIYLVNDMPEGMQKEWQVPRCLLCGGYTDNLNFCYIW